MKRLATFALLMVMLLAGGQAWASCPPDQGCPVCECPILPFFDQQAVAPCISGPDDSDQIGDHPASVALWGATAVDKDGDGTPDVWRICLICNGPHPCQSEGTRNETSLVRYFERDWTSTGPYWEDYEAVDTDVLAIAARYRSDPKIVVTATNSGWKALRLGNGTEIRDGDGLLVVRSEYEWYRLKSTDYSDGRRMVYTLDSKERIVSATESADSVVTREVARHFVETSPVTRTRKTELAWSGGNRPQITSTIYGYWSTNPPPQAGGMAAAGQLRYVLRPEATAAYLAQHPEDGVREDDLTGRCGIDEAVDADLLPYASVQCLEYGSYTLTDVFDNDQDHTTTDRVSVVKMTRVLVQGDGGCGGACGASGPGEWRFDYGENPSWSGGTDPNEWFLYKRSVRFNHTGQPEGLRTVEFLNRYGQNVFRVEQEMAQDQIQRIWIRHTVYDTRHRTIQVRHPSACTDYGIQASNGWVTAVSSDETGIEGLVEVTGYDPASGKVAWQRVRNGTSVSQPVYYQNSYAYVSRTVGNVTRWLVSEEVSYPVQTTQLLDPSRLTKQHEYQFYTGTLAIEIESIAEPAVPTEQNGSGQPVTVDRHYRRDLENNLYWNDWTRHEDGTLSYREVAQTGPAQGKTVKTIEDADTSQTADFAYLPPTGWQTPVGAGLHRITEYQYHETQANAGELKATLHPDGRIERTAYHTINRAVDPGDGTNRISTLALLSLQTVHMDEIGHYDYQPVSLRVDCVVGRPFIAAQGIPANALDGSLENDISSDYLDNVTGLRDLQAGFLGTLVSRNDTLYQKYRLIEERAYRQIPVSGEGNAGEHYLPTTYAYQPLTVTRNRVRQPDDTVSLTIFDQKDRAIETWQAVTNLPVELATTNDLVLMTAQQYDLGAVGDGNLTASARYEDDTTAYLTEYAHDWRNRQIATRTPDGVLSISILDNMRRTVSALTGADTNDNGVLDAPELLQRLDTFYDQRGQAWKNCRYEVNPETGTVGDGLSTLSWFDARGRRVKTSDAAGLFRKTRPDSLGGITETFVCFDEDETAYAEALNVAGDTVLEQNVNAFDDLGRLIQTSRYERRESSTKLGSLADAWDAADSRRSFRAVWHDALGRQTHFADYGDNGGLDLVRSDTPPEPNTSDDYIVTQTVYGNDGRIQSTIDNLGIETRQQHDALGRVVRSIEAYDDGIVLDDELDTDRTTLYGFDYYGRLATLVLLNPKGAGYGVEEQETRFLYDDQINGSLMTAKVYPDSTDQVEQQADGTWLIISGADHAEYAHNRLGQMVFTSDQRGVEREMTYDSRGRMLTDAATLLPSGVDATVRRIERTYDDIGRQILLTSYDAPTAGSIVNEVASAYGGWGNVVAEWQSHDGPVTEFTPVVEYVIDDGAAEGEARYVRLAAVIYPDGKTLEYVRDPIPGRIRVIVLEGATNAVYSYRGLNAVTGYDFPVTGGVMSKILTIDRFARVADLSWQHDDTTLVEQFQYTHDRGSRRTARLQPLDTAYSEWYVYDRFHQLVDMQRQRGDAQAWDLEHAGNWAGFQDNNKSQTRDHNAVNELTAIDGVTQSVEHDAAGNMTRIPKQAPWNKHYTCRWDAWNRLVEVFEGANLVVRSGYDGNSRRIWKYDGHETRDFYYDGWNVLDDVATRASGITTNAYCWGIDLSDSLQGAGGIGGLLSWTEGISAAAFYYSDANGNVAKVVDITGTNVLAEYQYDPYGTLIRAVGPEASANTYRFSSKYMDDETELLYYGLRFYSPTLGRWLSRDPLGELGRQMEMEMLPMLGHPGMQHAAQHASYTAFDNSPMSGVDLHGLLTWKSYVAMGCDPHRKRASRPPRVWTPIDPTTLDPTGVYALRTGSGSSETFNHQCLAQHSAIHCNTPQQLWLKAKEVCCRKYEFTCRFHYSGIARGTDFAEVSVDFELPTAADCYKSPVDRKTGFRWARVVKTMTCTSAPMKIGPASWTKVAGLFSNITMRGTRSRYARFSEVGSVSCTGKDLGPCD